MKRPCRRRRFAPGLAFLEARRLLTLSAAWLGQDGGDFVGTEGTLIVQSPNDYQDIHFRLTGLTGKSVSRVDVERYGGGGWTWSPTGGKNAMFLPDPADPSTGDLYAEPYFADPAGTLYQAIRVTYADGSTEQTSVRSTTAVDPNLRTPGTALTATFLGQDGQDWTGATIAVGPDGFQDVHLELTNLSAGASGYVRITAATTPPRAWETGVNPDGRWNAELLDRPGANETLGTTADVFFSSDVDLAGVPLTVEFFYDHWNPDYRSYTNRSGKTDSTVVIASATIPTLAMPVVTEADFAAFSARSLPQDAGFPGLSHAAIDAASLASLPTPQTFATVRSAVLSDQHGAAWLYLRAGAPAPYTGFGDPTRMAFDPVDGSFDFAPVRDESGATLTLRLTFDDGSTAVARFDGTYADLGRLAVDPRVGASTQVVTTSDGLLAALASDAPSIRLAAGTYNLDRPLVLDAPIRITADAGAVLNFVLSSASGSHWNGETGAIYVRSSHVALDGFTIRFTGTTANWNTWSRNVIQAGIGTIDVGLSFTNLDVTAPAAATPGVWETAVPLMNFDDGDTGVIADNALTGGWIQLGAAPWRVEGNDYRGTVADTVTPSFLAVRRSFDLNILGNHAHQVDPRGIALRFIVMGNSDSGQGIGNTIEGNTIDGGIGTPVAGAPAGWTNSPEIILTETYQPRFEGVPSAVSPDGYVVQVPYLRGPASRTGDVISILTGPHAGEWRMIAQALGTNRYLLDEPLPDGDYAIAIGRGFVDQSYIENTIDLRGTAQNNVAVVISGNHWGQRIEGNTFLGGEALRVGAGSNEGAFEGRYPAPWGWSRLPVFGLTIDGNTFVDAFAGMGVAHDRWANKSSAGRTYLTGSFSNNVISWSDPTRPAVAIGAGGDPSRGEPAYTVANYPWLTPGEIAMKVVGNRSGTQAAATVRVFAAILNGETVDDRLLTLPRAASISVSSDGQDGQDHVGGATGPDGLQDVHVALAGLDASKTIVKVVATTADGRTWSTTPGTGEKRAVLLWGGATADLFIQPDRDETGRALTVVVTYADGSTAEGVIDALYASASLPMPATISAGKTPAVVTSKGDAAPGGAALAFDGDVATKWTGVSAASWLQYQVPDGTPVVLKSYTIVYANDAAAYPRRIPKSWILRGSNDGVAWTTLDVRSVPPIPFSSASFVFALANTRAFRFFRLDSIASNGDSLVQIGEVRFNAITPAQGVVAARGDYAQVGEGAAQAFDGDPTTKWLDFSATSWLQYRTPDGLPRVVTQYSITSANDTAQYPGRAPRSWTLKGSNDGVTWTVLDVRSDSADVANFSTRVYRIDNTTAYRYYRVDDIVSNGDPIIQIADVAFQSRQVVAIAAGAVATPSSSSFRADAYYAGGSTGGTSRAIDVSGVASPAPQSVYQRERSGEFSYTIPGLTAGATYTLRLHFSENSVSVIGGRTFDVIVNGSTALDHFDILAAAGAMYKAVVRDVVATADASGRIVVEFRSHGQPGRPKVSAIEVVVPEPDLALGSLATSSSVEGAGFSAARATDGDGATRWSSGQWMLNNQAAWIAVDLGAVRDIGRVRLAWEAAFAVDYQVQVSDDGVDWTTVRSITGATTGGVVELAGLKARGRYVRIAMTKYNGTKNYSLYSLNVYAT